MSRILTIANRKIVIKRTEEEPKGTQDVCAHLQALVFVRIFKIWIEGDLDKNRHQAENRHIGSLFGVHAGLSDQKGHVVGGLVC